MPGRYPRLPYPLATPLTTGELIQLPGVSDFLQVAFVDAITRQPGDVARFAPFEYAFQVAVNLAASHPVTEIAERDLPNCSQVHAWIANLLALAELLQHESVDIKAIRMAIRAQLPYGLTELPQAINRNLIRVIWLIRQQTHQPSQSLKRTITWLLQMVVQEITADTPPLLEDQHTLEQRIWDLAVNGTGPEGSTDHI